MDLRLGEQRLDAVLDGDVRLVAEVPRQQLRHLAALAAEDLVDLRVEPLGHEAGTLDELLVEVASRALELGLDELRVGGGLLAVEHARADLDGVRDEARGVLGLVRQPHSALVVDDDTVDVQAVGDDAHLGEGETCSFHGYRVAPSQADLTERITLLRRALSPLGPGRLPARDPRRRGARARAGRPAAAAAADGRRHRRQYHGPGAFVRVACSASCDISGKLTIGYNLKVYLRLKSKTVGTGKGHLDGAGSIDVLVDLNNSAIRAVKRRHGNQLPVRVDATAKDGEGRKSKLTKRLTIPL